MRRKIRRAAPREAAADGVLLFAAVALLLGATQTLRQTRAEEIGAAAGAGALEDVLRRDPPKPFARAHAALEVVPGFHIDAVAREPLVVDPAAAAIDEDGRLYVAELRDYPYRPKAGSKPLGRVRLLQDSDGDGRYDQSTVFASDLLWAAGVAPWKGGVYVAAPPDIWYLKDTDGDHVADHRERAFTGFGTAGAQYILNNLVWGIDHRIYASVAGNGGEVRAPGSERTLLLHGRRVDFRFAPATGHYEAISGGAQFGNTFDDWGNRFLCDQDDPLFHVVMPRRYLERNPLLAVPRVQERAAEQHPPIFRSSPIEPWRAIRSARRLAAGRGRPDASGVSHHVLDGVAGTTVYRGHTFGPSAYGNTFSGDAQNNLVHRRQLIPAGVTFSSKRLDPDTEFVRSSDHWFRPVNFLNAPDGTLYVLDLAREILEAVHIPLDVVARLDLTSGRQHGRIWRIAPEGFRPPAPPRLSRASTRELASLLEHPGAWWRETAHRLLYERQDRRAVAHLRALLSSSEYPIARLHALWSLRGLEALESRDLESALADPHPALREHAIRLSEPVLEGSSALLRAVLARKDDPAARVRFQLALSLGESSDPKAVAAWQELALVSGKLPWMNPALLSAPPEFLLAAFVGLLVEEELAIRAPQLVPPLARVGGALGNVASVQVLEAAAQAPNQELGAAILLGVARGLSQRGVRVSELGGTLSREAAGWVEAAFATASLQTGSTATPADRRRHAAELLGYAPWRTAAEPLTSLLRDAGTTQLRVAAARGLARATSADVPPLLLSVWSEAAPPLRQAIIDTLLEREPRTRVLMDAMGRGDVLWSEIGSAPRQRLLSHPSSAIRSTAAELAGRSSTRKEVLRRYESALSLAGDRVLGESLAMKLCAPCHPLGKRGTEIGPNLALLSKKSRRELLVSILDPNREVDPRYTLYTALEDDGRITAGLVEDENEHTVMLRTREELRRVPRDRLVRLESTGSSFMPEGLELELDASRMAALLAYLESIRYDRGTSGDSPEEGEILPEE